MAQVLHLGYHYIREGEAPGVNCPPQRFRAELQFFRDERWEVLTCGEVADRMRQNRPLPERCVTLSFDDGLKDQYTTAFPILRAFNVPATFFIITCTLDGELPPVIGLQILIERLGPSRLESEILPALLAKPYRTLLDQERYDVRGLYDGEPEPLRRIKWVFNHFPSQAYRRDLIRKMFARYVAEPMSQITEQWHVNAAELVEMRAATLEIGSHSWSHPPLYISGRAEIEQELALSKQKLAAVTYSGQMAFAYPFGGEYHQDVLDTVARHYASAWNYHFASRELPPGPYPLYNIPRLHEPFFEF